MEEITITALTIMVTLVGGFSAFALKLTNSFMTFIKEEREQRNHIMQQATRSIDGLTIEVRELRHEFMEEFHRG